MRGFKQTCLFLLGLPALSAAPALASVTITSLRPSITAPQPVGQNITWTVTATDSHPGPLTFQFWLTPPGGTSTIVKHFNVGTLSDGVWTAQPFTWVPTGIEGIYTLKVAVMDFVTGEQNTRSISYKINPLVTGTNPVVQATANPLVALFSAPSCPLGSSLRVAFQQQAGGAPASATHWLTCHPPNTVTIEVAGMYQNTAYNMWAQTNTNGTISNGPTVTFTTGALPSSIAFPTFSVITAPTDNSNPVVLRNMKVLGGGTVYPDLATDLQGQIIWYYQPADLNHADVLTRPLQGGGMITIQDDVSWDPTVTKEQVLRQIDLAGNIVRETNMGAVQQQLVALGAVDGGACSAIPKPAPIGAGCAGAFHHDAIQTLPNGWTAAILDVEKIYPPGTQGNTSPFPVDVIGDMIIVMDTNWQVQWFWDSFAPGSGGKGYPGLTVGRAAPLLETCGTSTSGCPPVFLLGPNIAPLAEDWLHANTLYYWPNNGSATAQPGDLLMSLRNQDMVIKVDYKDGKGTKKILWTMGPNTDFTFVNSFNDPWPWFAHQHDVGIESKGKGVTTIFDNGNTRLSPPPLGLGSNCAPYDCNSRGMAIKFDEDAMTVTPVVSFDLGLYSSAMGSAQLLANGNYFFENPLVLVTLNTPLGYALEIGPTPAAPQAGPANILMNVSGPEQYRGWQMPSLYYPPGT